MSFYIVVYSVLLSLISQLLAQNVFLPFYQVSLNDPASWNISNGSNTGLVYCFIQSENINYGIFGGPGNFNISTIFLKSFASNQRIAKFYQMRFVALLHQPNFSELLNHEVFLQILIDQIVLDTISLNQNSVSMLSCYEKINSQSYYLNYIQKNYSLSEFNKTSFQISLSLKLNADLDATFHYPWGLANITVELFECDSTLCSSCNYLPRNCTTFCSIRCQSCWFDDPFSCNSCFFPNVLNETSKKCLSPNESPAAFYLNNSFQDSDVVNLKTKEIFFIVGNYISSFLNKCGPNLNLLGGYSSFGSGTNIAFLIPISKNHFAVRILFRFIKISSWDNEEFYLNLEKNTVLRMSFNFSSDLLTGRLCGDNGSQGQNWLTAIRTINYTLNHTNSQVQIQISTNLDDGPLDESWGINNLMVDYYTCDPSCNTCHGPSNADCDTCIQDYVVYENKCIPCDSDCQTCKYNSSFCTYCNQSGLKKYLSIATGTCYEKCPSHQYNDQNNYCVDCPSSCNECLNYTYCTSCLNTSGTNYYQFWSASSVKCLTESECKSTNGYYVNYNNHTCSKCNDSCSTCTDNSTFCTKCSAGYFPEALTLPSVCKNMCPEGYYKGTTNCEKCHSYCTECYGSSNYNCTKCAASYFLQDNNTCTDTCSGNTSPDTITRTCMVCEYPCKNCSGTPSKCQVCQSNLSLFSNSTCLTECPSEYYTAFDSKNNRICASCDITCSNCSGSGPKNCTSCKGSTFLDNITKECVSKCPNGTVGINNFCSKCDPTCETCLGVGLKDCITCVATLYKQPTNGSCLLNCDPGYYRDFDSRECRPCNSQCLTCEGPNSDQCLSCKNSTEYKFLNQSKICTSNCPDEFYNNYNNWTCTSCFRGCKTCENYSKNACKSCLSYGYFFFENSCYADCPAGVYANSSTRNCEPCSYGCALCLAGGANECLSCKNGSFFYQNYCLAVCPDGLFPNKNTSTCDNCSKECLTCFGPTSNECLSCPSNTFLLNYQCNSSCPDAYFPNVTSQRCEQCSSVCKRCENNPNNCSLCVDSFYLDQNKCLSDCVDGKYKNVSTGLCEVCNSSCLTCMTENECLSCNNGTYLFNNTCIGECPPFYWKDKSKNVCSSCDKSCKICNDSSNNTCSACSLNYYLFESSCLKECPTHYFKNSISTTQTCEICDEACDACFDFSAYSCMNCSENFYFLKMEDNQDSCVSDCGPGYFADNITKKCQSCSLECYKCFGPLNNTCDECSIGYFLLNNTCYKDCPANFYNNEVEGVCSDCQKSCKTCFGATETECFSCYNGTFLYEYQCDQQCLDGYYPNNETNECVSCHDFCETCIGPFNNGFCTKCINDMVLNDGTCQPDGTCPINKWQNVSVCELCNEGCKSCFGPTEKNCSSCKNNTYLLENECVTECPSSLVAVDSLWKCLKICDYTCSDCVGPHANECNSCPSTRYLGNGLVDNCLCNSRLFSQDSDLKNATCLACDENCNECNGPSPANCTKCPSNKDLIDGKCECPIGQYLNGVNCERCSPYCYTCFGNSSLNCSSCPKNQHLSEENSCVCDSGFYQYDRVCLACHYTCKECTGPDATECVVDQCSGNHVYKNGYCVCPFWAEDFGKNMNCSNKTTLNCHISCNNSQCFGPNADNCYSCKSGRVLQNNTCFCSDGTYEGSDFTCKDCHPSCKKCTGSLFTDCQGECISKTRGKQGVPIDGICDCAPGTIETLERDCPDTPLLLSGFKSFFAVTIYVDTPAMALIYLSQSTIVVVKFIETCQLFSYLNYMNLQYPLNTKTYFNMLNYLNIDPIFSNNDLINENNETNSTNGTNLNNTNDTTNFSDNNNASLLVGNKNVRMLEENNRFDRIKYGEGQFLSNSWILLVINGSAFTLALVFTVLYKIFDCVNNKLLSSLYLFFRWNLPIHIFNITSLQLFFYIGLEFSHDFDWSNSNSILVVIIICIISIIFVYLFKITNYQYSDLELPKYYGVIWDGTNTLFFIKRNYFFFNLLRKALVVSFLTSTTLDSRTQILGCMVSCLVFLVYIIFARPFLSNLEWVFTIIMEICFCFLLSVIFTYTYVSYDNASEKITFGYAIIVSLSLFMLATFIFAIIQIVKFFKKLHEIFKNREKTNVLLTQNTNCTMESSALAAKIGNAFSVYKKEVAKQKKVIVIYNRDEDEKKRQKEEERQKKEELQKRIQDIELEKKGRMGLQSIFNKQKNRPTKKRDSFEENDENDTPDSETQITKQVDFEDALKKEEIIKNRKKDEEKPNQGLESLFKKKQLSTSKKDSFIEGEASSEEEKEKEEEGEEEKEKDINIEMKKF